MSEKKKVITSFTLDEDVLEWVKFHQIQIMLMSLEFFDPDNRKYQDNKGEETS